jgi:hypothetical protein
MNRGVARIETLYILREIFVPTLVKLLDMLVVPYFLARFLSLFVRSYMVQTLMVRYSYATYTAIRATAHLAVYAYHFFITLHNEIRDSRYLVGTELTNR